MLRRVSNKEQNGLSAALKQNPKSSTNQRQGQVPGTGGDTELIRGQGTATPQEIIAAQRAASKANQKALISAQANEAQGVDVVLPARGTLRSSRQMEPNGEIIRYSYIDDEGETYDISELLEEEMGDENGTRATPYLLQPPALVRHATDQSAYVTAPSTPEPTNEKPNPPLYTLSSINDTKDLLRGALQQTGGQPERLEETLQRVINKVKTGVKVAPGLKEEIEADLRRKPASPPGVIALLPKVISPLTENQSTDAPPRASSQRSTSSRQAEYHVTAANVNRIITRHQQQPSIASIMSDLSIPTERPDEDAGTSTPQTATSSTHPTPPFSGAVFTRPVSSANPTPWAPVVYKDDFGIKAMMAIIEARAREYQKAPHQKIACDEVQRALYGEMIDLKDIHPEMTGWFLPLQARLDAVDREIDELLGMTIMTK